MNFLLRSTICRTPSIFSFNRQLSSRRALRSILPKQQNRSTNSKPFGFINENNVVVGIIAANGIVYAAWKIAHAKFINNHDQTLLVWMTKHFMVSWDNVIRQNRVWTLLTSAFSHFDMPHFLINSLVLYSFGPLLLHQIGLPAFVQLFLFSAIGCSMAHIIYQRYYEKRPHVPAVGASGVTTGMTIVYACISPFEPVLLFFIVPMPVFVAVGAYVGYDLYRALTHRQGQIGSAGHVGGAIAGVIYYFWKIRMRL